MATCWEVCSGPDAEHGVKAWQLASLSKEASASEFSRGRGRVVYSIVGRLMMRVRCNSHIREMANMVATL